MGQGFQGKGRPSSGSWKGCSLWGKAALDTLSLPSALQKPLCPLTAQGLGTKQHTRHSFLLTHAHHASLGKTEAMGLSPGTSRAGVAPRGEGQGPAAASRRVHMWRGRGVGGPGPRGRVYISAKFPDGRGLRR